MDLGLQHIKKTTWLFLFVSIIFYTVFAYDLHRSEFVKLLFLYSILFTAFIKLVVDNKKNTSFLLGAAILFRLILLVATPNLSDDFYRFIWDGRMIWEGLNPYLYLPESNTRLVPEGQELYKGMGSMNGSHYTCYPPINQLTFLVPAIVFSKNLVGSTIVMRLLIIAADIGTFYFGKKLLRHFKQSEHQIFFYLLNPFVILELTGNLHFEGVMLFFLAASLYYLFTNKWVLSALLFALSVSVKLIPLLFLPVFLKKLGFKKAVFYYVLVGGLNLLFFIPFLSQALVDNFMSSIHLYFQNFEFNASIYYIIREIGYQVTGYNIIQSVGKITPILVILATLLISFFRKNQHPTILFSSLLFTILIYYSLASIVHPWYIAIPLFLSLFTRYKFPLVWSFFIILSYSAYTDSSYHENLTLVAVEYLVVFGFMIYELFFNKPQKADLKEELAIK
ncbi:glycosyltransferase 87 family protein [Flavicella sediminum]|uniref:glycosyltransferase 87 family protein n=1 Tax=Flavicella sediminum TaxID=2585141 RepID=UPI001124CAD1|nr:glycosyltransferase 87 family protein [Flavicella sediminum]